MLAKRKAGALVATVGLTAAALVAGAAPAAAAPHAAGTTLNFTGSANHPFVVLAPWNYLDGYNPLETNSLTSWYQTAMFDPPLAFVSRINNSDIVPAVASHWTLQGKTLTIYLNPQYRWSNGRPVTAEDAAVSLDISLYLDQWMGLSAGPLKIVNAHEIQVQEGSLYDPYFVAHVLGYTPVYAAQEFASFIPKNIYQLFLLSNQSGKAGSNASTEISNLLKKMEAADPKLFLSCGPWTLVSDSTSEALFKPNPYFPDHRAVPWVELLNSNNTNEIYAWADESKFTLGGVPQPTIPLVKQWLSSSPYHQVIYNRAWYNVGLDFNTSIYPYGILKVRQALAYLINRPEVARVANPLLDQAVGRPVGYFNYLTLDKWLTPSEMRQLNPYNYNPGLGVRLLESVGFKKTANGWLMPNGQPFVPAIYAQTTNPDWEAAAEVIKDNLAKVGINANVYFLAPNVYAAKLAVKGAKGLALAIGWEAFSVHSYNSMVDALDYTDGVFLNYGAHSYTVGPGDIGLIPMTLPNGQPINVAKVAVAPNGIYSGHGAAKQHAIWLISLAGNYNLPMLPLWTQYRGVNYVDDQYYTGFAGGRSDWWVLMNNLGPNWEVWFYLHMIHPTAQLNTP